MKLSDLISCVRGDIRVTKPVSAERGETLSSAARRMRDNNVGTLIIVEGRKPVGIITDRDLALALGAEGASPQTTVQCVMTTPVRTIPNGAGVFAATQCMRDAGVRRLPIVDQDGYLVGIVSLDDLLRLLGRELANLTDGIKHEMEMK